MIDAPAKPITTLGRSLFVDPLGGAGTIGDIRSRLEIKAAACAASGGFHGYPLHVNRIKNPKLRSLVAAGMIFRGWSNADLLACGNGLAGAAETALVATLDRPTWGQDDFNLMGAIELLESTRSMALTGGKLL